MVAPVTPTPVVPATPTPATPAAPTHTWTKKEKITLGIGIALILLTAVWVIAFAIGEAVGKHEVASPAVPAIVAETEQPVEIVAAPNWVESYTISSNEAENFTVTSDGWSQIGNDFYTRGNMVDTVTVEVINTSDMAVVINYSGNNWNNGIIVQPGDRVTFTGAVGDFRVTLLAYANQ